MTLNSITNLSSIKCFCFNLYYSYYFSNWYSQKEHVGKKITFEAIIRNFKDLRRSNQWSHYQVTAASPWAQGQSSLRQGTLNLTNSTSYVIYMAWKWWYICVYWQVSAARVLQDTCNYIRNLHREVDDLSERLSELLANTDTAQAALIRSLLTQ